MAIIGSASVQRLALRSAIPIFSLLSSMVLAVVAQTAGASTEHPAAAATAARASSDNALTAEVGPYPDSAPVTIFGSPDSFGALGSTLPSAQTLDRVGVDGLRTPPGHSFFFSAVASDGTLFIADMTQTFAEMCSTACEMNVTCFNARVPSCFDDATGSGAYFAHIRVPNWSGALSLPDACPQGTRFDVRPPVAGSEVDDLEVVVDENGIERVIFDSFVGSLFPATPAAFPMYGSLTKRDGTWQIDASSLRTPEAFQASSTEGAKACPGGTCGAVVEMAVLPASMRVVMLQYFGRTLMVNDIQGTVLATYTVAAPPDWCDPSHEFIVSQREAKADPTGRLGDERFVVFYEGFGGTGQIAQEFSYDELEPDPALRLAPVTAPLQISGIQNPAPGCGPPRQTTVQGGLYDDHGNLWIAHSRPWTETTPAFAYTYGVFLKDPTSGKRRTETACGFLDPTSGLPRPWGFECRSDLDVGAVASGFANPRWDIPELFLAETFDPSTATMYGVGWDGRIVRAERFSTESGDAFTMRMPITLDLGLLGPLEPGERMRNLSNGIVDSERRALWLPVATTVSSTGFWDNFLVGQVFNAFIYRVNLDTAYADQAAISRISTPTQVSAGRPFVVAAFLPIGSYVDRADSFLTVHLNDAPTPAKTVRLRSACGRTGCKVFGRIRSRTTRGVTGSLTWQMGIRLRATGETIFATGRLVIEPRSAA